MAGRKISKKKRIEELEKTLAIFVAHNKTLPENLQLKMLSTTTISSYNRKLRDAVFADPFSFSDL